MNFDEWFHVRTHTFADIKGMNAHEKVMLTKSCAKKLGVAIGCIMDVVRSEGNSLTEVEKLGLYSMLKSAHNLALDTQNSISLYVDHDYVNNTTTETK